VLEFSYELEYASLLYQLYRIDVASVILLEPPWFGIQIPTAPLNKTHMSFNGIIFSAMRLGISSFLGRHINYELSLTYRILRYASNSQMNYLGNSSWFMWGVLIWEVYLVMYIIGYLITYGT